MATTPFKPITPSISYKKKYVSIRKASDFQRMYKLSKQGGIRTQGKQNNLYADSGSFVSFAFVCYYRKTTFEQNRFGVVASKKVGNAIKRNRAKRLIREGFRLYEPRLREFTDKTYDFVFVARAKTPELNSTQVGKLIGDLLCKIAQNSNLPKGRHSGNERSGQA